jgi:hypothetical protein
MSKSNGKKSVEPEERIEAEEDFSDPMSHMDARPAEAFHVCKLLFKRQAESPRITPGGGWQDKPLSLPKNYLKNLFGKNSRKILFLP